MKKLFASSLILVLISGTFLKAQQTVLKPVDEKITPGMTEVWDPEVKIIQPGEKTGDAPSDVCNYCRKNDCTHPLFTSILPNQLHPVNSFACC